VAGSAHTLPLAKPTEPAEPSLRIPTSRFGTLARNAVHHRVRRIAERVRRSLQHLRTPEIAISGSFGGHNLGDWSFAVTLASYGRTFGRTTALQDLGSIVRYPIAGIGTLIGGGAIATKRTIEILADRYRHHPGSVALVGVDLERYSDSAEFSEPALRFLDKIGFLSVRCKSQTAILRAVLSRADVVAQPDIVFAMPSILGLSNRSTFNPNEKVLGINATPLCMSRHGSKFVPSYDGRQEEYESKWPELAAVVKHAGAAYTEILRETVDCYLARGWSVCCIPFTPTDELFARTVFPSNKIKVFRYVTDAARVFCRVQQCSRFIATRFHSHVFALAAGVPTCSIAYAPKCKDLWDDLGVGESVQLDVAALVRDKSRAVEVLLDGDPACLEEAEQRRVAAESYACITRAFDSVTQGG
jgi:hypothetical protein